MKTLIFVLGDQLTPTVSSLAEGDRSTDIVLMRRSMRRRLTFASQEEAGIRLLCDAAFRRGTGKRRMAGRLSCAGPGQRFQVPGGGTPAAVKTHEPDRILITEPAEWRVREMIDDWRDATGVPIEVLAR